MGESVTFSIRLPRHLYNRLEQRAQAEHRTKSGLVYHLLAPSLSQEHVPTTTQSLDSVSADSLAREHADLHTWHEANGC